MKLKIVAVAALPLLLSGCAEVISFTAGFGAGYFTGQYMAEPDPRAAQAAKLSRQGTSTAQVGSGMNMNASGAMMPSPYQTQQQPAYGYYYSSSSPYQQQYYAAQMQRQQYAQQQMTGQQPNQPMQAAPYGLPQQTTSATDSSQAKAQEANAAEVKIVPATPPAASYQPNAAAQQPLPLPPPPKIAAPTQPQATAPTQPQAGGGYYIPPIQMTTPQTMPIAPPPPSPQAPMMPNPAVYTY